MRNLINNNESIIIFKYFMHCIITKEKTIKIEKIKGNLNNYIFILDIINLILKYKENDNKNKDILSDNKL